MSMNLTILGSGTCVPNLKRGAPANFLKIGTQNILVDCGAGTLKQMVKAGIRYQDLDMICFTHFHPDHIDELPAILHALNWTPGFKRTKNLTLLGPKGFKNFLDKFLFSVAGVAPRPDTYKIIIKEISTVLHLANFEIHACKTKHSLESIAYKFKSCDKSIVISGDCDYDDALIKFCHHTDLLLLDCSFIHEHKMIGHLTSKECGIIGLKAKVKKLILTHLYYEPHIESGLYDQYRLREARKNFETAILGEDFMVVGV
jgi:ribonuclease BN (tRNA processing enzyme)